MLKYLFGLILSVGFFADSFAQGKSDTLIYYVQYSGNIVTDKNAADFILFIMPKNPDNNLYPVIQYYPDGKCKLIASSSGNSLSDLSLEGPFMAFFPTGKRQISTTYKNGRPSGDEITYYPNGKIYTQRWLEKNRILLMECRDSTGTVLATGGNGRWLKFSNDFKFILSAGSVINGVKDGEWTGEAGKKIYKKGDVISGDDHTGEIVSSYFYDSSNPGIISAQYVPFNLMIKGDSYTTKHTATRKVADLDTPLSDTVAVFNPVENPPSYPGGLDAFYNLISKNLEYPWVDRSANVQGNVFISFVVEKDGSLTEFNIERAPSKTLGEAALKAVKHSKNWIPATQDGKPVRVKFTVPVSFK